MAFREGKQAHPFTMEAIVISPDHLHCIWTLSESDDDFSTRLRQGKAAFSRQLLKTERRSQSRLNKGERGIWQRRFWEHAIRGGADYQRHVDYLHYNPVKHGYVTGGGWNTSAMWTTSTTTPLKHGYVTRLVDRPYSSFHRL